MRNGNWKVRPRQRIQAWIGRTLIAGLLGLSMITGAWAQFPARPVKLVVPVPPGGAIDGSARIIAQSLSQALGQPVVIDNRPGADGAIAAANVIAAEPDGYTLFFATSSAMCAVPTLRKRPPYNPQTSFAPISLIGSLSQFLLAHESVPVRSLSDLLGYARSNPGALTVAIANSTGLIASAQLKQAAHIDMIDVPYKGDAPALTDLVGGRVQLMFASPGAPAQFIAQGKLRALAALSPTRSPLAPDVPTFAEAGMTAVSVQPWVGVFGPAGVPADVADRLAREFARILAQPEIGKQLTQFGLEAKSSTPRELAQYLDSQVVQWRTTIQQAGIEQE